jgi:integrase
VPQSITLEELVQRYSTEFQKTKASVGAKRRAKVSSALQLVVRFFGTTTIISEIDPLRCSEFRDLLNELPSNLRKHFPDSLALEQVTLDCAKRGLPKMAWETQDHYLRSLKTLFGWARSKWLINDDPTLKLEPVGTRASSKEARDPFTTAQLISIFSAPLYTGCRDDAEGYSVRGANVIRGTRFWIPLIGLFTGMRLNEICQLEVADIRQSSKGNIFIYVNADAEYKSLKSTQSKREIPIHRELKRFGFLAFVERQKSISRKLFPELKRSKRGYYSERISRWFNEGFLINANAKTDKTSFHSFRHCFRDALRNINAPPAVVQGLGGWEMEEGSSANYGSGLLADKLVRWVHRMNYEGLDLSHLYLT